jgi:hypothetical protein
MYSTLKHIHDDMVHHSWQHVRNFRLLQCTNDAVQETVVLIAVIHYVMTVLYVGTIVTGF